MHVNYRHRLLIRGVVGIDTDHVPIPIFALSELGVSRVSRSWVEKRGFQSIASGLPECDALTLPDCDVGQFSHSRLVRGPQPLIDCLPETCGRRVQTGTWRDVRYTIECALSIALGC